MNDIKFREIKDTSFEMTFKVTYDAVCPACGLMVTANTLHECTSGAIPATILPQRLPKRRDGGAK